MSDPQLHARASQLFLELRALEPRERERLLAQRCAEDPQLGAEVRSLLAHDGLHDELPDELGESAAPLVEPEAAVGIGPGSLIGPYRVLERIGRGGSGLVFLAEQEEPVRRRVAIKVVPEAALGPELAARFEVERRALECTDHPGIARILDAGRTSAGLPYLVMDYVEGASITAHCAEAGLGLTARVELVRAVADAVQHAHQRGVVHRDLKPGNILVARADGRPRVVDFGIAKAVGGSFRAETQHTSGLPLASTAYMAPEQTGLGGVDTRADVYALGAVLYELVSGRAPLDTTPSRSGDLVDVLERIRHAVPPPVSRAGAHGLLARAPRAFVHDLDCILQKALEKAPERRYATVGALMDDLTRLLRREPIAARAPTALYRATRFAQRNRLLVAALAAVTLALVVGVLGLTLGLLEARRQRASAFEQMEAQAELNRFLTDDLLAAAAPERAGKDASVLQLLDAASAHIEERFPTRPLVAAAVHHTLGEAFATLGEFARAEPHLARAIALRHAAGGGDAPDTVRSEIAAASLEARREHYAEAKPLLEAALVRARLILGPDDRDLYAALNALGVVRVGLGELDAAEDAFDEALAGRRRLLGDEDPAVFETIGNLAFVHEGKGEITAALELQLAALRTAEGLADPPRMTVLGFCNNIGATYQDLGRDAEAAPYLRRAAAIAAEWLGPTHPATLTIEGNLAALEAELGEPAHAAELFRRLVEARTASLGALAPDTLTARYGLCDSLAKAGQTSAAAEGFEALLADAGALGAEHWLAPQTQSALARVLADCGRTDEALELAHEAEQRLRELLGPEHHRTRGAEVVTQAIEAARARR